MEPHPEHPDTARSESPPPALLDSLEATPRTAAEHPPSPRPASDATAPGGSEAADTHRTSCEVPDVPSPQEPPAHGEDHLQVQAHAESFGEGDIVAEISPTALVGPPCDAGQRTAGPSPCAVVRSGPATPPPEPAQEVPIEDPHDGHDAVTRGASIPPTRGVSVSGSATAESEHSPALPSPGASVGDGAVSRRSSTRPVDFAPALPALDVAASTDEQQNPTRSAHDTSADAAGQDTPTFGAGRHSVSSSCVPGHDAVPDPDVAEGQLQFVRHGIHQRLGGRFDVEEVIGCGAVGVVMRCRTVGEAAPASRGSEGEEGDGERMQPPESDDDEEPSRLPAVVAVKRITLPVPQDDGAELSAEAQQVEAEWRRECRMLQRLRHPHILRYYDHFRDGASGLCIATEYAPGGSLQARCRTAAQQAAASGASVVHGLPDREAAAMIKQLLRAVGFLHSRGVAHRDIKAANVLVNGDGRAKLCDFGLAAARRVVAGTASATEELGLATSFSPDHSHAGSDSTPRGGSVGPNPQANIPVGSVYWMAPEVARGDASTTAADVWAVGCTAFEIAVGRPPFYDRSIGNCLYHLAQLQPGAPPPTSEWRDNRAVSPPLGAFLARCLVPDLAARPDVPELLADPWLQDDDDKAPTPVKRHHAPQESLAEPSGSHGSPDELAWRPSHLTSLLTNPVGDEVQREAVLRAVEAAAAGPISDLAEWFFGPSTAFPLPSTSEIDSVWGTPMRLARTAVSDVLQVLVNLERLELAFLARCTAAHGQAAQAPAASRGNEVPSSSTDYGGPSAWASPRRLGQQRRESALAQAAPSPGRGPPAVRTVSTGDTEPATTLTYDMRQHALRALRAVAHLAQRLNATKMTATTPPSVEARGGLPAAPLPIEGEAAPQPYDGLSARDAAFMLDCVVLPNAAGLWALDLRTLFPQSLPHYASIMGLDTAHVPGLAAPPPANPPSSVSVVSPPGARVFRALEDLTAPPQPNPARTPSPVPEAQTPQQLLGDAAPHLEQLHQQARAALAALFAVAARDKDLSALRSGAALTFLVSPPAYTSGPAQASGPSRSGSAQHPPAAVDSSAIATGVVAELSQLLERDRADRRQPPLLDAICNATGSAPGHSPAFLANPLTRGRPTTGDRSARLSARLSGRASARRAPEVPASVPLAARLYPGLRDAVPLLLRSAAASALADAEALSADGTESAPSIAHLAQCLQLLLLLTEGDGPALCEAVLQEPETTACVLIALRLQATRVLALAVMVRVALCDGPHALEAFTAEAYAAYPSDINVPAPLRLALTRCLAALSATANGRKKLTSQRCLPLLAAILQTTTTARAAADLDGARRHSPVMGASPPSTKGTTPMGGAAPQPPERVATPKITGRAADTARVEGAAASSQEQILAAADPVVVAFGDLLEDDATATALAQPAVLRAATASLRAARRRVVAGDAAAAGDVYCLLCLLVRLFECTDDASAFAQNPDLCELLVRLAQGPEQPVEVNNKAGMLLNACAAVVVF